MSPVIRATCTYHCFLANLSLGDAEDLARLEHPGSFALDDYDVFDGDFDGLPDRPLDFIEGTALCPFIRLGHQHFSDSKGTHFFWLEQLKQSGVALLSHLRDDQVEQFAKRWSEDWIYEPFQWAENISREMAEKVCREQAFQKLQRFLRFFHPLCRQALVEGKNIYVLREQHEYCAA